MTNEQMRQALQRVHHLFLELTRLGWFDQIAGDIHPDEINATCDAVEKAIEPMTVYVVAIADQFSHNLATLVFSSEEKADAWLAAYVRENWSEHYDDECPADLAEAVNEYFNGGVVEDENLDRGWYVVDDDN